jgi:BirA family biotin operon repressor/biotin-[acetyl-CoA-carboxylase] ligase
VGVFVAAEIPGYTIERHGEIGSTNDRALDHARAGLDRVWVTADRQTGGRGRGGRAWSSPSGNLYASLGLIDPCEAPVAPQLGFVAGVALHAAVESVTAAGKRLALKWPNDVLLDGAKLSGLLVEGGRDGVGRLVVAIGMGVNCVAHPADTPYPATSLAAAGFPCDASGLFGALRREIASRLSVWERGAGFAAIRAEWLERAHGIGAPVRVRRPDGDLAGMFRDIDAEGRLLLAIGSEIRVIEAGDVFFGSGGSHEAITKG